MENQAIVAYLTQDSDPSPYYGDDEEDGEPPLRLCKSQAEYDKAHSEGAAGGKLWFDVEVYRHGNVAYAVRDTGNFPDRQWDVGPAGIYIPSASVQAEWAVLGAVAAAAIKDTEEHALAQRNIDAFKAEAVRTVNQDLSSYSDWCNGDVYGMVIETITLKDGVLSVDAEETWGYIGITEARTSLQQAFDLSVEPAPSPGP